MRFFQLGSMAVVLATLGPTALIACGSEDGHSAKEAVGSVNVALTGVSSSGITYRLRNGAFAVTGPKAVNLSTETNPDATVISSELPAGNYLIKLKTGWNMERFNGMAYEPVEAILLSQNPAGFAITDQGHTSVVFLFRAGDDVIQLGNGVLDVSIGIDDGSQTCPMGQVQCGGACVNVNGDPNNCGACAHVCALGVPCINGACVSPGCPASQVQCDGACVDVTADPNNCGACGNVCSAFQTCNNGACVAQPCPPGMAICGGVCINVTTDTNNCGACGNVCSPINGAPTCNNGMCSQICNPGFRNCDGNPVNGCETNVSTDLNNCGTCGALCAPPGGQGVCSAGACQVSFCMPGRANCNGTALDGCETILDTNPSCGGPIFASIPGDATTPPLNQTGVGEQSLRIHVTEADEGLLPHDLGVRITLTANAPNYDIEATCDGCGAPQVIGDNVALHWADNLATNSSRDIFVNVVYRGGASCAPWSLTITGNDTSGPITCPPL